MDEALQQLLFFFSFLSNYDGWDLSILIFSFLLLFISSMNKEQTSQMLGI